MFSVNPYQNTLARLGVMLIRRAARARHWSSFSPATCFPAITRISRCISCEGVSRFTFLPRFFSILNRPWDTKGSSPPPSDLRDPDDEQELENYPAPQARGEDGRGGKTATTARKEIR